MVIKRPTMDMLNLDRRRTTFQQAELGYTEKLGPEFSKRGVKVIGLSVDPVDDHRRWLDDIEATQAARPNFPKQRSTVSSGRSRCPRTKSRAG